MHIKRLGILGLFIILSQLGPYIGVKGDNSGVVLNEIAWMGTLSSSNDEWLELYNGNDQAIDLTSWQIRATDDSLQIQLSSTIAGQGFFVLERSDDQTISSRSAEQIYTGALKNSDVGLQLIDPQGVVVDQVSTWHAGNNGTKATMARRDPLLNGNELTNWCDHSTPSTQSSTDADGNLLLGSPGEANVCPQNPPAGPVPPTEETPSHLLIISEVMAFGSEKEPAKDHWLELYNPGDQEVILSNWTLQGVATDGSSLVIITEANRAIQPKDTFLISYYRINKNSALAVQPQIDNKNLQIKNDQDLNIELRDDQGNLVDQITYPLVSGRPVEIYPSLERIDATADGAEAASWQWSSEQINLKEGLGSTFATPRYTPFSPPLNSEGEDPNPRLTEILINEILPTPKRREGENEFIELWNKGDTMLDLRGWELDDEESEDDHSYVLIDEEKNYQVGPGQFLVFYSNETGITLSNEGDGAELYDPEGNLIDSYFYAPDLVGRSWGRNPDQTDEWLSFNHPTPGQENREINRAPVAIIKEQGGTQLMTVNLTAEDSYDQDEDDLSFLWTFEPDVSNNRENPLSYTYSEPGEKIIGLKVVDALGMESSVNYLFRAELPRQTRREEPRESVGQAMENGPITSTVVPAKEDQAREIKKSGLSYAKKFLRIKSVLPNPKGSDDGQEKITLLNPQPENIALNGWCLKTQKQNFCFTENEIIAQKTEWEIDQKVFRFNLKNKAGLLELIDPSGSNIDVLLWDAAESGEIILGAKEAEEGIQAQVMRIIDGDTFETLWQNRKTKVRLIGIESPETKHPFKTQEYFGNESQAYLEKSIANRMVTLKFDQDQLDKYGRLLAYVYVDGRMINAELIEQGYAKVYPYFPFAYQAWFTELEKNAQQKRLGLWEKESPSVTQLEEKADQSLTLTDLTDNKLELSEPLFEPPSEPQFDPLPDPPSESCTSSHLKIDHFLPNPIAGEKEYLRLINHGPETVCLSGWQLDDSAEKGSKIFQIQGGSMAPLASRTFRQTETGLALNNQNDCVRLIDPLGKEQDRICYNKTHRGERFTHEGGDFVAKVKIRQPKTVTQKNHTPKTPVPSRLSYQWELPHQSMTGHIKSIDEATQTVYLEAIIPIQYAAKEFDPQNAWQLFDQNEALEIDYRQEGNQRLLIGLKPAQIEEAKERSAAYEGVLKASLPSYRQIPSEVRYGLALALGLIGLVMIKKRRKNQL